MYLRLIILHILFFLSLDTTAASFDCNNASNEVEKLICSDDHLGYLDKSLGEVYKSLRLTNSKEQNAILIAEQRAWIKQRNIQCQTLEKCQKIYPIRISNLRKELETSVTLPSFSIDRQSCWASKNQEVLIKCVDLKVYDPCDDAGGKWGLSRCGWVHADIAQRKITSIEKEIVKTIQLNKMHGNALENFQKSIVSWTKYRDEHCHSTNTLHPLNNYNGVYLYLAFCKRRLNEQRLLELENIMSSSK